MIHINPQGLDCPSPRSPSLTAGYMAVLEEYREACLDVHRRVWRKSVGLYESLSKPTRCRGACGAVPHARRLMAHMCISRDVDTH